MFFNQKQHRRHAKLVKRGQFVNFLLLSIAFFTNVFSTFSLLSFCEANPIFLSPHTSLVDVRNATAEFVLDIPLTFVAVTDGSGNVTFSFHSESTFEWLASNSEFKRLTVRFGSVRTVLAATSLNSNASAVRENVLALAPLSIEIERVTIGVKDCQGEVVFSTLESESATDFPKFSSIRTRILNAFISVRGSSASNLAFNMGGNVTIASNANASDSAFDLTSSVVFGGGVISIEACDYGMFKLAPFGNTGAELPFILSNAAVTVLNATFSSSVFVDANLDLGSTIEFSDNRLGSADGFVFHAQSAGSATQIHLRGNHMPAGANLFVGFRGCEHGAVGGPCLLWLQNNTIGAQMVIGGASSGEAVNGSGLLLVVDGNSAMPNGAAFLVDALQGPGTVSVINNKHVRHLITMDRFNGTMEFWGNYLSADDGSPSELRVANAEDENSTQLLPTELLFGNNVGEVSISYRYASATRRSVEQVSAIACTNVYSNALKMNPTVGSPTACEEGREDVVLRCRQDVVEQFLPRTERISRFNVESCFEAPLDVPLEPILPTNATSNTSENPSTSFTSNFTTMAETQLHNSTTVVETTNATSADVAENATNDNVSLSPTTTEQIPTIPQISNITQPTPTLTKQSREPQTTTWPPVEGTKMEDSAVDENKSDTAIIIAVVVVVAIFVIIVGVAIYCNYCAVNKKSESQAYSTIEGDTGNEETANNAGHGQRQNAYMFNEGAGFGIVPQPGTAARSQEMHTV